MRRIANDPRPDRRDRARRMGFAFADIAGEPYWDEGAHYEFTAAEIDLLEDATNAIEAMSREAVEFAIRRGLNEPLGIPAGAWPLVVRSWEAQEPSLYGRLDLRFDGGGPPKLLEYNADTPTALFEAAVVQWEWLESGQTGADQFNTIHEALIATWPRLGLLAGGSGLRWEPQRSTSPSCCSSTSPPPGWTPSAPRGSTNSFATSPTAWT